MSPVIAIPSGLVNLNSVANPFSTGPNTLAIPDRFPETLDAAVAKLFNGPIGVFSCAGTLAICLPKNPGLFPSSPPPPLPIPNPTSELSIDDPIDIAEPAPPPT